MADDPLANVAETFSAPIEGVIIALGKGISEAQAALDQNSIKTQEAIDSDPALSRFGLQAQWYQFPRVELQLKLAISMAEQKTTPAPAAAPSRTAPSRAALGVTSFARALPLRLFAQPVSAAYQNHFNYNSEASSQITLSIVPVPAPRAGDQAALPPRLTQEQVQKAVLTKPTKFSTATDSNGNSVPDPKLRFDVNFNSAARTWYVLQYDPANPSVNAVVAAVDDSIGSVRMISP